MTGIARHYKAPGNKATACGRVGASLTTNELRRVDCFVCRKVLCLRYKVATWKQLLEEHAHG